MLISSVIWLHDITRFFGIIIVVQHVGNSFMID